jgi:hypothetical protein
LGYKLAVQVANRLKACIPRKQGITHREVQQSLYQTPHTQNGHKSYFQLNMAVIATRPENLVRGPSPIGHIFYSFFVILLSFSFPFLFFLSTFSLFIFYVLKVIFLKKRDNVLEKITGSKNVCEL